MNIKPTESELEILQVLWQLGSATVREVNESLSRSKGKEVGYTTTLKLMQIMYDKGMLERDSSTRTHIFKPLISRKDAQRNMLNKMIDSVFNGSSAQLVMQALNNQKSSKEEIEMIRKYLDELDQNK
ncbi:BlaI/MecI/CopY family transcriptional regulator [Rubrolithibacter danxiaensis]|uniref:BlaI/MecI/CopY family transcriptional regulator n=1 Tax=Rubrolithibacter danxiaensis TaxID=3390805 RepID=UPI003BF830ED